MTENPEPVIRNYWKSYECIGQNVTLPLLVSLRACGARIASRTDELREEDVGTGAGLFEVKKIGDEYFTFVTECKDPKACTILLRGASKEILAVRDDRKGVLKSLGPLLKIHDSATLRGRLMRVHFNHYKESNKGLYSQSSPQEEVLRYFNRPFVEYLISSASEFSGTRGFCTG